MRNRKSLWVVCSIVVAMIMAGQAAAATVYVDAANTSGVENGKIESPFASIQAGINAAVAGDVVSVAPGIYYGSLEMKNDVPVVSQKGPKKTIIDGMGASTVLNSPYSQTANSTIDGFTVRNGGTLIYATNRVNFWSGSSWSINNCILQDATLAIVNMPMASVSITKSVITNISLRAIDAIWCPAPQFTNVTINNAATAFFMYQIGLMANNTTVTNVKNFVELWGSRGSGYVYGSNNNVWGYETYAVPTWSDRYPSFGLQNTLSVDPMFVSAPTDYSLQSGSPLIDAGVNVGLPYYGAAPDIGAYEFAPQSTPELVEALAESYQAVPVEAFKNAAEQRLHALQSKLLAILRMLDTIRDDMTAEEKRAILGEALSKLMDDVWAKADGFYGGNPHNDWITTQAEQDRLYPKVMEVKESIERDLALL